jgi:hypothetical protein
MVDIYTINLDDYRTAGVKVYAGRERGSLVRHKSMLDEWDKKAKENSSMRLVIKVPNDVRAISSGFLIAFLGDTIRTLGEFDFRMKVQIVSNLSDAFYDTMIHDALAIIRPLEFY